MELVVYLIWLHSGEHLASRLVEDTSSILSGADLVGELLMM
jgi:hypothetical protein